MEICAPDKCTGCYACVNVCPHGCISMVEDALGVVRPVVAEDKCVHCNLCIKTCPNNVSVEYKYPMSCYAAWITDSNKRRICASGGVGTAISEYMLRHGGVVFGSRYDENMNPIMTYTENMEELERYKGSRYVQSMVGSETYKKVREFLKQDRLVAFIGTPCQIAGLKTFLRKDYENLLTVDLICHGVCPAGYLKDEISFISKKYRLTEVADARFRGNDGNNYRLSLWNKDGRKLFPQNNYREKFLHISEAQQYYIKGFLLGITMRENCYSCNYARPERVSDITIGDFIGLGKDKSFGYPKKNVSSVLINTVKGREFYSKISAEDKDLVNIQREYIERLAYKPSLIEPYPRHPLNPEFVKLCETDGYVRAIHAVLRNYMIQLRIRYVLRFFKRILLLQFKSI